MEELLSPAAVDRLLWVGGSWLLLCLAWGAVCMWVETDAESILGKSMPWSIGFVAAGAVLLLASFQWGLGTLPLFWLAFLIGLVGYIGVRDKKAPSQERIFSVYFARQVLLAIAI